MHGMDGFAGGSDTTPKRSRPDRADRPRRNEDEDLEYRLALEASKNEAEEDARKRASKTNVGGESDDDLAKALKLSREEEELRKKELEEANASSLFDDLPAQNPQPTGLNQGYQQQGAVDWFGNPVEQQQQQQQPQSTGYLNNAYSQPVIAQPTGFQNGYGGYGYQQQPQQTGFDQMYQAQQQTQQQFNQSQQTGYNPWASQMNAFDQPQQQSLQQQNTAQPGSNNPWASASPQPAQDSLYAQPTGSNNPFASSLNRPQPATQRTPTLSALQEQKTATQFSQPSYNPIASFQAPQQTATPQPPAQQLDPHRTQLNALLASGEGQDTFGNVGNMRIPAQHTAPGTFVNSSGQGINRLEMARTGNNPFLHNQFTGAPQQQQQQQQQQQFPAQTGPPGAFGSSNPFGGQKQQGGQNGSLIDL